MRACDQICWDLSVNLIHWYHCHHSSLANKIAMQGLLGKNSSFLNIRVKPELGRPVEISLVVSLVAPHITDRPLQIECKLN